MEAFWPKGVCERSEDEWKANWRASAAEADIGTEMEVVPATLMITWAKNDKTNEPRFSPVQLVPWWSQRLLGRSWATAPDLSLRRTR